MSVADIKFVEMCKNIIENGHSSEGQIVRPKWSDGTSAHTIKSFCVVNRYDLSKEFPILTIRPVNLKAAIDEILWIWQKKSNNVKDLNSKIWDSWSFEKTSNKIIKIKKIIKEQKTELKEITINEIKNVNAEKKKSNNCGDFFILEKNKNRRIIQFEKTGFINDVSQSSVSTGEVKDYYQRSVNGLGYYGNYKRQDILEYFGDYFKRWVNTWENMIRRCSGIYSGDKKLYENIFVDEYFHSCENFLDWVIKNNRYDKKMLSILQIDKDYYKSNCYSPESCTILTPKENTSLTLDKWYIFKNIVYYSLVDLAEELNRIGIFNGFNIETKRYDEKKLYKTLDLLKEELTILYPNNMDSDENFVRFDLEVEKTIKKAYGYQLGKKFTYKGEETDQVDFIIKQLKENPYSRRMVTNLFVHEDLKDMGLEPCAYGMTFNVTNGKLNAILNQRSQDILVANGWNVAQYAILIHMFAQVSNLAVGEFVHVIADAHIYDKHIPIVKELIERKQHPAPKLLINPTVRNFYDFKVEDFYLYDYKTEPQIKNIPVAE